MVHPSAPPSRGLTALVLALAAASSAAHAQPRPAVSPGSAEEDDAHREARALFQLAVAHYDAGRYREAANEFERAYQLTGRAELLYNVHLAYRDLGELDRAAEALRAYLASSVTLDPATRRTLENRLTSLDAVLATQRAEAARRAEEAEAVRRAEEAEATRRAEQADMARLAAEAEAEARGRAPTHAPAASGERTTAHGADASRGADPDVTSDDDAGGSAAPIVTASIGGAAGIGAAVASAIALRSRSERDAACDVGPAGADCPAGFDQSTLVTRFERARGAAWSLAGAGGTLVTVGVLWAALASDEPERSPAVAPVLSTGRGRIELGLVGRF